MVRPLAQLLMFLGLPSVAAAALAILLSESSPISLSELARRTGYAKSHLSTHMRILAVNGLVNVVKSKGRILYVARRESVIRLIKSHLESLRSMLESASHAIVDQDIKPALNKLSRELTRLVKELEAEQR